MISLLTHFALMSGLHAVIADGVSLHLVRSAYIKVIMVITTASIDSHFSIIDEDGAAEIGGRYIHDNRNCSPAGRCPSVGPMCGTRRSVCAEAGQSPDVSTKRSGIAASAVAEPEARL